jgi:hypothetical protein
MNARSTYIGLLKAEAQALKLRFVSDRVSAKLTRVGG